MQAQFTFFAKVVLVGDLGKGADIGTENDWLRARRRRAGEIDSQSSTQGIGDQRDGKRTQIGVKPMTNMRIGGNFAGEYLSNVDSGLRRNDMPQGRRR